MPAMFAHRCESVHHLRDAGEKRAAHRIGGQGGLIAHGAEHLQYHVEIIVKHGVELSALRG